MPAAALSRRGIANTLHHLGGQGEGVHEYRLFSAVKHASFEQSVDSR
jgi:hypothetical protein